MVGRRLELAKFWEFSFASHISKVLRAENYTEEQERKLIDYLITCIGDKVEETDDIWWLEITKQNDIIITYKSIELAQSIVESRIYNITVHYEDPVQVPCGPVTTEGLINYRNYAINCRRPQRTFPSYR